MGKVIFQEGESERKETECEDRGEKETRIESKKKNMVRTNMTRQSKKERVREAEIDRDRVGDRETTGAEMTWIHRTCIDYLRMKS